MVQDNPSLRSIALWTEYKPQRRPKAVHLMCNLGQICFILSLDSLSGDGEKNY